MEGIKMKFLMKFLMVIFAFGTFGNRVFGKEANEKVFAKEGIPQKTSEVSNTSAEAGSGKENNNKPGILNKYPKEFIDTIENNGNISGR